MISEAGNVVSEDVVESNNVTGLGERSRKSVCIWYVQVVVDHD
jgi:hypothetical protein